MTAQALIAAALVLASALYVAWVLMPAAWRGHLGRRLGLRLACGQAGGCGSGCGGCGAGSVSATAGQPRQAVITVHRRAAQPR